MNYLSNRYLLCILSIFIIGSSQAVYAQESTPSFVKVGQSYKTQIGLLVVTFTVEKIEGQWIKVKVTDGIASKEISGDVWLNLRSLGLVMENKEPVVEAEE
ncbi:MAG: hypothetical protein ACSHX6_08280 [Akkermansiaceae bacterium]